jgi:hypothetical protein
VDADGVEDLLDVVGRWVGRGDDVFARLDSMVR